MAPNESRIRRDCGWSFLWLCTWLSPSKTTLGKRLLFCLNNETSSGRNWILCSWIKNVWLKGTKVEEERVAENSRVRQLSRCIIHIIVGQGLWCVRFVTLSVAVLKVLVDIFYKAHQLLSKWNVWELLCVVQFFLHLPIIESQIWINPATQPTLTRAISHLEQALLSICHVKRPRDTETIL